MSKAHIVLIFLNAILSVGVVYCVRTRCAHHSTSVVITTLVSEQVRRVHWPLVLSYGYTFQSPKAEDVGSLGADFGAGQSLWRRTRILVHSS